MLGKEGRKEMRGEKRSQGEERCVGGGRGGRDRESDFQRDNEPLNDG